MPIRLGIVLLRHGGEDMAYYARISEAATFLKTFMLKPDGPLADLGQERLNQLRVLAKQAQNAYYALSEERLFSPARPFTLQRNSRKKGIADANWFLRRQNAELDAFEEAEKRRKKGAGQH